MGNGFLQITHVWSVYTERFAGHAKIRSLSSSISGKTQGVELGSSLDEVFEFSHGISEGIKFCVVWNGFK